MEDERTITEKILAGEANLSDYDLDSDFNDDELLALLDGGIIAPRDISDRRASDMVISGLLSYDEYPFERFSNYEKVRQLEQETIGEEEFKAKAELEYFDGDDWLALLAVWPEMDAEAPWDMIRNEARAGQWFEFLAIRPECAEKADWKRIFEQGKPEEYFRMLAKQPALYEFCPDKKKLLEADSGYWVKLIIRQPKFAKIYPLKERGKVKDNDKFTAKDELEEAILKQQNRKIIQLTVEANSLTASKISSWYRPDRGYGLKRPNILETKEFLSLPVRTAAVVYGCAMNCCLRQQAQRFLGSDSKVSALLKEVEETPKLKPSAKEEKLVSAIMAGDNRKVCRLIEKEKICIRSMTQESMTALCCALKKLNPYTVVLLFAAGIHEASVAVLLKFLLRACESESGLNGMDYKERLMYTNLLIHILQEDITPEDDDLIYEDWYPMGNSIKDGCGQKVYCHRYSYYFDPQHLYEPRYADGENE